MKRLRTLSFAVFGLASCLAGAQSDGYPETLSFFESPIGAELSMIKVDGGTFLMGSQREDASKPNYNPDLSLNYSDESPVHSVDVETFYIARFETTRELWADLMGGFVPYDSSDCAQGSVSFKAAMLLVNAANNAFAHKMPKGSFFDLPTEEQWEYAARGGRDDTFAFAGSNDPDSVAVWGGATEIPGPVASLKPNSLGIFDMSGNAAEWTKSYYSSSYGATLDYKFRVIRGGGVHTRPGRKPDLRVSARSRDIERMGMKYYGVRLVLNVPAIENPPTAVGETSAPAYAPPRLVIRGGKLCVIGADGQVFDLGGSRLR